jgi:putative peptide-modifying radical SAM enzyme
MKEFDNGLTRKWNFDFNVPADSQINLDKLKRFIFQDKKPVIVFYGGEPLLEIEKIKEIMDAFENSSVRFCMQTNGKLLNELPKAYMNRFSRILVSLDGDKKRTDYNRGEDTYDLVVRNLRLIRQGGYKGEIVARMTVAFPDLIDQVEHLLSIKEIDSIHWQLDMGFYKNDYDYGIVSRFVQEYNESLSKLLYFWFDEIKKGRVLKIYPFLGIFESLFYNTPTKLRCGAGHSGYAITTKGDITTCPIMNNITDFYVGDLDSSLDEIGEISVGEPCITCSYSRLCGGRCLYANRAKLWPEEGQKLICKTIKHLIDEIKRIFPEIKRLIEQEGIVSEKDFEYEKYFGPEIIP